MRNKNYKSKVKGKFPTYKLSTVIDIELSPASVLSNLTLYNNFNLLGKKVTWVLSMRVGSNLFLLSSVPVTIYWTILLLVFSWSICDEEELSA